MAQSYNNKYFMNKYTAPHFVQMCKQNNKTWHLPSPPQALLGVMFTSRDASVSLL